MNLSTPISPAEFAAYFELRWRVLREPWGQPRGSERDDLETDAFHVIARHEADMIVGVGRLHRVDTTVAQIRYMAVAEQATGRGVGRAIIVRLEQEAQAWGCTEVILNARDTAVRFYTKLGYDDIAPAQLIGNLIPHRHMRKRMTECRDKAVEKPLMDPNCP